MRCRRTKVPYWYIRTITKVVCVVCFMKIKKNLKLNQHRDHVSPSNISSWLGNEGKAETGLRKRADQQRHLFRGKVML